MSFSLSEYTKIASPDPLAGFNGAASRQEGNGREGRTRGGGRGEGRGKGKQGRRGKGEVGGIAPWLLGDRRPCRCHSEANYCVSS